ncbi:MAG TPA: hypothetical protein VFN02_04205 [Ktedonobacteraceae bacterium]|nr:hypothetical protein [Ktedonobacteraceae bacterium]
MSDQDEEEARHLLHQRYERPEPQSPASDQDDITMAIAGIRSRLDQLASINADNIFAPGGPQSRYHQIVEEAYAALLLIETQVDELRTDLEYQHKRLDEIRDAALAEQEQRS